MNTDIFNIEKTFREVIMGAEPSEDYFSPVGRIAFDPKICYYELNNQLNDAKELLKHIRNNWDKDDFDGEEVDRKIDELLGKTR